MSFHATLARLISLLAAKPQHLSDNALASTCTGINTDTRSLKPGDIFVALRGEKFDGHGFVATAVEKGAIAAIVDGHYQGDLPVLQVRDTLQAYQQIASWWRSQFHMPVIGVTGSVGKTTTKELIAAVLGTQGNVLKTHANFNNEIGVPKTLLGLDTQHDFAVIEMAMRGRGEIALLTQIARPTIGVITNVGTAHIERLGSEEAIAQAKCELLAEMPQNSVAILNYDNSRLISTANTVWQGKTITYGLEGGDIRGELLDSQTLKVAGLELPLPLPGRHNAVNFLAALAVAKVLQIDWSVLKTGLTVDMPSGRSQRYELADDVVILDESYNAAPEAMLAALQLLAQTPGKRHIAVLGAMKELGERSRELHQKVGTMARQLNLDLLLVLVDGTDAEAIAQSATGIPVERCATHVELVERLKGGVKAGDRILFKAAHSVGLDRVVEQFRAEYCCNP
ncbi:MAG: UDP-N-acetylmuramoyl-tripeptide--D-alanyl-D-alanine ligase [Chroococcidiopsis cubana SAG 39.79]|uniref:UDP-N-acetylmuramoyl-tripeptide--D-alanyl-D-alanine ligase n=1 Tax=Chroococcidiopsis cubana SAG 39.79 TaxID=388085 RepID=A0AB37UQJ8_9CYAN|nr:UDP-N-acetylmuramoyl-tripeptide--D-alanyl-D-alanine ligase [Chroococcidiopsis cubana]MDZ4872475.1 UDP-N-acetylmuramoyl-tripeptide--D-alanyl-D-alanine ligase [Chroococcidiopsis cubana SAG 39.79]PSB60559.1 UDP-N-acetylmuramoyl-tripeptide--D-alanyl-D-alanine ligase [Chroococcidiopsis cubana CCALA 043]RUT13697.1 UDP-N-acetylmuramoyl-tripeptide--D-alanyl-D-alanine ligase [Chroococcidiopsis cubana SAG 39.79]